MLGGAAMKINAVVARDNSGKYTSIQKAVSAAPKNSKTRWVIYVKAGVYYEQVQIPSGTTNLYLVGDGIGRTVITGNRNVGCNCGVTTFQSATLGTYGCTSWSTPFLSSS
jgi:pectinesterase